MNLQYLKTQVRVYQQARTDGEREQLIYHLDRHLNLIRAGQAVSPEERDRLFTQLEQIGLQLASLKRTSSQCYQVKL